MCNFLIFFFFKLDIPPRDKREAFARKWSFWPDGRMPIDCSGDPVPALRASP